jgi:hypothetical protein
VVIDSGSLPELPPIKSSVKLPDLKLLSQSKVGEDYIDTTRTSPMKENYGRKSIEGYKIPKTCSLVKSTCNLKWDNKAQKKADYLEDVIR